MAQTPAQRLAAWSQALMLRRIDHAEKVEAAEEAETQLVRPDHRRSSDLMLAPKLVRRQTRSRARRRAMEIEAGPP